jgi:hypothetical protein
MTNGVYVGSGHRPAARGVIFGSGNRMGVGWTGSGNRTGGGFGSGTRCGGGYTIGGGHRNAPATFGSGN